MYVSNKIPCAPGLATPRRSIDVRVKPHYARGRDALRCAFSRAIFARGVCAAGRPSRRVRRADKVNNYPQVYNNDNTVVALPGNNNSNIMAYAGGTHMPRRESVTNGIRMRGVFILARGRHRRLPFAHVCRRSSSIAPPSPSCTVRALFVRNRATCPSSPDETHDVEKRLCASCRSTHSVQGSYIVCLVNWWHSNAHSVG